LTVEEGTEVADILITLLRTGRVFVGCEGGERDLAYAMTTIGSSPFFYSSDFPHEVDEASCRHELKKLTSLEVSDICKTATMRMNANSFYGFGS
jgi:hypothetical protein